MGTEAAERDGDIEWAPVAVDGETSGHSATNGSTALGKVMQWAHDNAAVAAVLFVIALGVLLSAIGGLVGGRGASYEDGYYRGTNLRINFVEGEGLIPPTSLEARAICRSVVQDFPEMNTGGSDDKFVQGCVDALMYR